MTYRKLPIKTEFVSRIGSYLWHVSNSPYHINDIIGPWADYAFHWEKAQLDSDKKALEIILESVKPANAPSRKVACYATPDPRLVRALLRKQPSHFLYLVNMPDDTKHWGPVDMLYIDWMLSQLKNGIALGQHPQKYWNRDINPHDLISFWELLAERLTVLSEVPRQKIQEVFDRSLFFDRDIDDEDFLP